jgi:hypothetical protein
MTVPKEPFRLSPISDQSSTSNLNTDLFSQMRPPDSELPVRRAVPTYLRKLDRQWRGGWSWQWPLVIAGPKDGGKSLFVQQLLASCLLSYLKPWRLFIGDFSGDYRPERIQRIVSLRVPSHRTKYHLGRLDKISLPHRTLFQTLLKHTLLPRTDVALWVFEGWDQIQTELPLSSSLEVLSNIHRVKQVGLVVTIRSTLEELLPQIPWDSVPFLLYFTPIRHGVHRLRLWLNGRAHKIYDRQLVMNGYLREAPRWTRRVKK